MLRLFRSLPTGVVTATFCLLGTHVVDAAKSNATVITVGGTPIKRSQIDTISSLMAKTQRIDVNDVLKRQALDKLVATNLIGQALLDREAKALHIQATAQETDSVLKGFRTQFPDDASFKKALHDAGDTEAKLREKLMRQIRADKVLAAHVDKMEMPSDKELADFWEKHKAEFPVNDSLRALQIVLLDDGKSSAEEANQKRRKLESLRQDLIRDSAQTTLLIRRFMSAAAQLSEGPEAKTGGDLQRFDPKDFNPEFQKQVRALRVGQLSPVFRTPLGFHLIFLIEKYDGKFDSYKLQMLQTIMGQKNAQTGLAIRKLLKELAAKYPVKYLAPIYRDSSEAGIYN